MQNLAPDWSKWSLRILCNVMSPHHVETAFRVKHRQGHF